MSNRRIKSLLILGSIGLGIGALLSVFAVKQPTPPPPPPILLAPTSVPIFASPFPKKPDLSVYKPCECPFVYDPVCGTDYISYNNTCDAACVGIRTAYKGVCRVYDNTQQLPSHCRACSAQCTPEQVLFEDEHGCPFCECRVKENAETGD